MNWYDVTVKARVEKYGVVKEQRFLLHTNCHWPDDKLRAAVAENVELTEPGLSDVQVTDTRSLYNGKPTSELHLYAKVINFDQALGI